MTDDFFRRIAETTAKAQERRLNVSTYFPDQHLRLYGADAGTDYAQTILADLKSMIGKAASFKRTSISLQVPTGGKAMQAAMLATLRRHLHGFAIDFSSPDGCDHELLRIDWQSPAASSLASPHPRPWQFVLRPWKRMGAVLDRALVRRVGRATEV
jgi:hypothetical protein